MLDHGKVYLLRYNRDADEWTLQSGFDGDELLARPSIELVTVDVEVIRRAEKLLESCEHCHIDDAQPRAAVPHENQAFASCGLKLSR